MAERRIVRQPPDQGRVIAAGREKGVAAVREKEVGAPVESENRLAPAQILLQFRVAVLIGRDDERIGLAHDVVLLFLGKKTEENAVVGRRGLQVLFVAPGEIELDVGGKRPHGPADVSGAFPFRFVARVDEIEATCQFDFPSDFLRRDGIGAVGDVVAVHAPSGPFGLKKSAQRHNSVRLRDDYLFKPVEEDSSRPADKRSPYFAVLVVPSVNDGKAFVFAEEFSAEKGMERDHRAVSVDDVGLEFVDSPGQTEGVVRRRPAGPVYGVSKLNQAAADGADAVRRIFHVHRGILTLEERIS